MVSDIGEKKHIYPKLNAILLVTVFFQDDVIHHSRKGGYAIIEKGT